MYDINQAITVADGTPLELGLGQVAFRNGRWYTVIALPVSSTACEDYPDGFLGVRPGMTTHHGTITRIRHDLGVEGWWIHTHLNPPRLFGYGHHLLVEVSPEDLVDLHAAHTDRPN